MSYVPIEKMLTEKQQSIYKLVLTAAMRANELTQGAQPLVKTDAKKVTVVALEEIAAGKVRYEETKSKSKKSSE
jgi:DNA-directed RNA polymerase omega subunit